MKVSIDRNSGKEPRALVEKLAPEGQEFPVVVSLTHKNVEPLVVPSSGINTPLESDTEHQVKVKSFEQAWLLVTDLSEFAARAESDDKEYAVVTVVAAVTAPAEAPADTAVATVSAGASAEAAPSTTATTSSKAKQATQAAESAKETVK